MKSWMYFFSIKNCSFHYKRGAFVNGYWVWEIDGAGTGAREREEQKRRWYESKLWWWFQRNCEKECNLVFQSFKKESKSKPAMTVLFVRISSRKINCSAIISNHFPNKIELWLSLYNKFSNRKPPISLKIGWSIRHIDLYLRQKYRRSLKRVSS